MQKADPKAVKKLDSIVEEYNKLKPEEKKDILIYSKYFNQVYSIIYGIIKPENNQSKTNQQPNNNN